MSSRETEDTHLLLLKNLLDATGLECEKTTEGSVEETVVEEPEEYGPPSIEDEDYADLVSTQEEETVSDEIFEKKPELFPSPSLRRLIPDKVRLLEAQNRIHVLPETFKTDIDPQAIPKIMTTPQQKYIEILADMVGCTMYRTSLAEYWFLDTLANLLRRAQQEELSRETQALLILWFCEWMKEIQNFDEASRPRMLRRFKDTMLSASRYIVRNNRVPTPEEAGVYYMAREQPPPLTKETPTTAHEEEEEVNFKYEWPEYKCPLIDLTKIIHYIYDLFSTDYQYDLVRSIFTFTPEYTQLDMPYQMQNPKKNYVPLKPLKPAKETKKHVGKGKKKEEVPDTQEYLALMKFIAHQDIQQQQRDEEERELWNRKSHILPLQLATNDEFFDKYWPPPTPPPEPEPVEVKPKGKKKIISASLSVSPTTTPYSQKNNTTRLLGTSGSTSSTTGNKGSVVTSV